MNRREWLKSASRAALAIPVMNLAGIVSCGKSKQTTVTPAPASGYTGTDDQLLDDMERAAFRFFWEQGNATTGLVKDRALAAGNDTRTVASIAATGFGLTALCIGDSRGYGDSAQIKQRVTATLNFILNQLPNVHGFFFHFIDWASGARQWNCEVSSIDTSILLCGVLMAREYYATDANIVSLATQIYDSVEWPWMLNGGTTLAMGWYPESGFIASRWDHYCELMMIYLLAIGANRNALPPSAWLAWSRPTVQFEQYTYISGTPALFTHQFSHAWFDFRNKKDAYANYFQNSVTATQAHKAFCLSLQPQFPDYKTDLWGITSSDSASGYHAWGGPPATGPLDGTVVPCASAGSLPFLPQDCLAVLRKIRGAYPSAWQAYGYVDAFNPLTNWYDGDVIGIDLGISMLMAENFRSGSVWNSFMKSAEVQRAMSLAGFTAA